MNRDEKKTEKKKNGVTLYVQPLGTEEAKQKKADRKRRKEQTQKKVTEGTDKKNSAKKTEKKKG